MATHANTTINNVSQARTCAALLDAFCDAHDAYEGTVERATPTARRCWRPAARRWSHS
jgi:hypothetical protein